MERAQTKPYFVYMNIFILFVLLLFDLGLVLKFQFSFVIYIIFKLCYLAEAFIQSDLQMRTIDATKTNKRATICNKVLY